MKNYNYNKATPARVYNMENLLKSGFSFQEVCIKSNLKPEIIKKFARNLITRCPAKIPRNLIDSMRPNANEYYETIQKLKEELKTI